MQTVDSALEGFAPIVNVGISEHEKYRRLWTQHPEYRQVAPGEGIAELFLKVARPKSDSHIIDFGAGTGRGALNLALFGALIVHMIDFVAECLDEDVRAATISQPTRIDFTQHHLRKPIPIQAEYGFCTDVMEHIPPAEVEITLFNILKSAQHVFFQISCEDDVCGKLIGHPLHLSVHPFQWWKEKFESLGCMIHYSQDFAGRACVFYVSAWRGTKEVIEIGKLNNTQEKVIENVRSNIARGFNHLSPQVSNDQDIMILAGGPSLDSQLETIKQLKAEGVKVVTVNGAYNWALAHGITPVTQIVLDSRPFNKRFVEPAHPDCKYLLASQVDPSLLDAVPQERTWLFHVAVNEIRDLLNAQYDIWFGMDGGSTVLLRAIPMMRTIGHRRMHIFGFDSCITDSAHHAYAQPENDSDAVISVAINGGDDVKKIYRCHAWMVSQAHEFIDLVKAFGNEIELEIYGNGLIKGILEAGASRADADLAKVFEVC